MTKCPMCGYSENMQTTVLSNVMSQYTIDADSKPGTESAKVYGILNNQDPYVTIPATDKTKEIKLRRIDYIPSLVPSTPVPDKK